MFDIMESIGHSPLKSGTKIFKAKRKFVISKSSPRADESHFTLIFQENFNLIVSEEAIHERKKFTSGTIIYDLVNKWCRVIVLRTCLVNIPIIDTNPNNTLFLGNRNGIGTPFGQRYQINKMSIQQFIYFYLDSYSFSWMN